MTRSGAREAGYSILEMAVVMMIFIVITAAVGSAFAAGGEVYGDGVLRTELNETARKVVNRILAEIEETQSDAPGFAVGTDYITYNRVESISATGPTFGPQRVIRYYRGEIHMIIKAERVAEPLTKIATGLAFQLDETRLTVTVTVAKTDAHGNLVSQEVSGVVNVHR